MKSLFFLVLMSFFIAASAEAIQFGKLNCQPHTKQPDESDEAILSDFVVGNVEINAKGIIAKVRQTEITRVKIDNAKCPNFYFYDYTYEYTCEIDGIQQTCSEKRRAKQTTELNGLRISLRKSVMNLNCGINSTWEEYDTKADFLEEYKDEHLSGEEPEEFSVPSSECMIFDF